MELQDFDPDCQWYPDTFDCSIWYIGTENTIREGLKFLFENLIVHGHILIEEPIIFDYMDFKDDLVYVILYRSLSKLEYLEYMYEKSR